MFFFCLEEVRGLGLFLLLEIGLGRLFAVEDPEDGIAGLEGDRFADLLDRQAEGQGVDFLVLPDDADVLLPLVRVHGLDLELELLSDVLPVLVGQLRPGVFDPGQGELLLLDLGQVGLDIRLDFIERRGPRRLALPVFRQGDPTVGVDRGRNLLLLEPEQGRR